MNRPTFVLTLLAVSSATWGACEHSSLAYAAPNCGGQSAAPQPVPYTCVLPVKVIDGTGFSATVYADGTTVTVTINLETPRTVPTDARIVHHVGISGAGGDADATRGTIPPGSLSITLTDSVPCRAGQLDVKVWHVGNGSPEGRIGGPWIENGTGCIDTQVVTTTSPPVQQSSPPVSTGTPGGSTPATPRTPSTPQLPATGVSPWGLFFAGWIILALGFLACWAAIGRGLRR